MPADNPYLSGLTFGADSAGFGADSADFGDDDFGDDDFEGDDESFGDDNDESFGDDEFGASKAPYGLPGFPSPQKKYSKAHKAMMLKKKLNSRVQSQVDRVLANERARLNARKLKRAKEIARRERQLRQASILGQRLSPAMLAHLYPGMSANVIREGARGDDLMYGIDSGSTAITASSTATLSTLPQKRHFPKSLTVTEAIADDFLLSDIRVGVEPVLATVGNLSMAVFIQNSTTPPFRAVLCEVGNEVSVTVTNIDTASHRFTATFMGTWVPGANC